MSKIGALRDLLVALLQEHERDGAPDQRAVSVLRTGTRGQNSKVRQARADPTRTCTTR